MITRPATRSGCASANFVSVCAPIEAPASTARSIPRSSSTASRSSAQPLVAVVVRVRRVGLAVGARVVGDHAVAGALERARAHHHVAPGRRQPVQQHDRAAPSPASSPASSHAVRVDPEIHASILACVPIDATEATFERDVIQRSYEQPVVVDFWAEWCGPCRSLGPVIEKAVAKRDGQVDLVKVDTDANPRLSQAFGIQSIPAVKAFKDGKVVDEFIGALPPAQVERFLDGLVPSEADALVESGSASRPAPRAGARARPRRRRDRARALARRRGDREERARAAGQRRRLVRRRRPRRAPAARGRPGAAPTRSPHLMWLVQQGPCTKVFIEDI